MATVRRATAQDADFLRTMLVVAADWDPNRRSRSVADVMNDPALSHYIEGWPAAGDVGVVAEDERRVGAAWWRFFSADDPGYGFVQTDIPEVSIGVLEACRGRGIGTQLLKELVTFARLHRVPALSLSVEDGNPAVRRYTRAGWRVIARNGGSLTMLLRLEADPTHPTATI